MSIREFEFSIVEDNEPMSQDLFFTWLWKNYQGKPLPKENNLWFVGKYLEFIGFDSDRHYVSHKNLATLLNIFGYFYQCYVPNAEKASFDSLFIITNDSDSEGFYVQGKKGKYKPTKKFLDEYLHHFKDNLLEPFSPRNFYVKIVGDKLYICYQHIIGSWLVCYLN